MSPANIHLSDHSVERFRERCRPTLELGSARTELERLLPIGLITHAAPDWHRRTAKESAEAYLVIGDDYVLPLVRAHCGGRWIAKTFIARGGISEATRARRNGRRSQAAHARRTRRRERGRHPESRRTPRFDPKIEMEHA